MRIVSDASLAREAFPYVVLGCPFRWPIWRTSFGLAGTPLMRAKLALATGLYYSSDLGATGICANNIKTLAMILRHGPVANYTLGAA
jgi:hypothetical protein